MEKTDLESSVAPDQHYSGILERGLAILELLATSATGLPLGEVSRSLRIPRSATHRLLAALASQGYVHPLDEHGTYGLTSKLQRLGFSHLFSTGFVDATQPVLNRLAIETGELVRLAVADDDHLTWVARAQGSHSHLRFDPDMGQEVRLSCAATGYAWLSSWSDDEALALALKQGYGSPEDFGPEAPRTAAELLERIVATRKQGYAVAVQTFADWLAAIAVPLRHPTSGYPLGVVSISGPFFRLPETRLREISPLLIEAAKEIQQLVPGSPYLMSPSLAIQNVRKPS